MAAAVDLTDVCVDLVAELGRARITLGEARRLRPGDTVALDKLAGEACGLLVNGRRFASGESVVTGDRLCLRLTRLVDPEAAP